LPQLVSSLGSVKAATGSGRFDWSDHRAVLFDLDGVLTPTAEIHRQAWGELFRDHGFTDQDYLDHVDGKPRYDGVRSFLASRHVTLPEGAPTDPPGSDSVCALGNWKNALFTTVLERDGISAYPGSLATLSLLDEWGIPSAVVSSSRNAQAVLRAAGLHDRFAVVVDGEVAARRDIAGKPAPDMFLVAAGELGVDPHDTVVVEDAVSGVAAGVAGGFVVVGVDRGAGRETLLDTGASVVVEDLDELLPSGDQR
jgi:beta-phosphoglucomutase family hydrolase